MMAGRRVVYVETVDVNGHYSRNLRVTYRYDSTMENTAYSNVIAQGGQMCAKVAWSRSHV
jgi:hypothetical protein